MLRVALKNLLAHRFRSLALVFTVVLGVSFVAGTYVLTDTITRVFDEIFDEAYSAVDVSVRTESPLGTDAVRDPLPDELLEVVGTVEGVDVAEGAVFAVGAEILDSSGDRVGNPMAPAFGLSWSVDDSLSPLSLRAGRKPSGPAEIAIDVGAFDDGGFALGDEVRLVTPRGPETFELVGVAGFGRADNIAGATLSVFDLDTAQQVMQRVGMFDSIDVRAATGVSPDLLQDRVASALPDGIEAVTSDQLSTESDEAMEEGLGFFKTFLLAFAFIALFVGAFIIYNTFGIVVAQRTKELALLRALGASRGQVLGSVVFESVVLGLAASAIGLGLGVLLAIGLKAVLGALGFGVPSGSMVVLPRTVLVALVGGTAITTLSALAPALRASRVAPIAAMGGGSGTASLSQVAARNIGGGVLGVSGIAAVLLGLRDGRLALVGGGALAVFVGVAMLAPMVARPVVDALGAPVARTRGAAGLLARENAMRSARRTAATASALMVGTALMTGALILSGSMTESVERAVSRGALSDLVVTSRSQIGFSPAVGREVLEMDGVAGVYPYRISQFRIGEATKEIAGVPLEALTVDGPDAALDIDVRSGDIADLDGDSLAVHRDVASDRGWDLGDRVSVTFASGSVALDVAVLYDDDTLVGDYVIDLDTFTDHLAEESDLLVMVNLEPGAELREVQAAIAERLDARFSGLRVQDKDQYVSDVKDQVNQFLALITALLALAVIIALLGVLITMLLAVFERTRELGLLRAVGMERRQMRAMVRWEAAMVSTFGATLGVALGIFFGLAMAGALEDVGLTERVVPLAQLGILAVVIVLLGVGAALYPARRAARLDILVAIAHS